MKNKLAFTLSGALVMLSSAFAVANYAMRKKSEKNPHTGELICGIAGFVVGTALLYEPDRRAKKGVVVEQLFDENDEAIARKQIREVLDTGVDRGTQETEHLRTIEVDEDTSIEDFI